MSLLLSCPSSPALLNPYKATKFVSSPLTKRLNYRRGLQVKAFFFNPIDEPLVKEALKEPVAFMGGMFAGLLRLDLNEEPLKEWVTRTVEASEILIQEINGEGSNIEEEEAPQEIEIE